MAGISFSGLASGIDFDALVEALLLIERRPITNLRTRQSALREDKGAITDVKNRVENLRQRAEVFTSTFDSVFKRVNASSSNEAVVKAKASTSAAAGTYDIRVERLASAMTVISKAAPAVASFTAGATGADLNPEIEAGVTRLGSLRRRDNGANFAMTDLGRIEIDDGATGPVSIDLSTLTPGSTVQDLLDLANSTLAAAGSGASVSLNADATGLLVSSSTGSVSIANADAASTATKLGLATAGLVASPVDGGDLDPDLQADTSIAALNGGAGAALAGGLTLRLGAASGSVDLSAATTLQGVLDALNASGLAVSASLGPDGIRLDATAADKALAVDEGAGTAAADLGLAGLEDGVLRAKTAADASFARVFVDGVSVEALRDAFNRPAGRGYAASVVDGRLVLNSSDVGADGALEFRDDAAAGGILEQLEILVADPADDSTVSNAYQSDSSRGGLVAAARNARFSTNGIVVERDRNVGIADVIQGVTLDLVGVSSSTGPAFPADYAATTVTVSADDAAVVSAVKGLVDQYNSTMGLLGDVTRIDTEGDDDGTLVGNSLVRNLKPGIQTVLVDGNKDVGQRFAALFQLTDPAGDPVFEMARDGTLSVNESRLRAALADDRAAVEQVFVLDTDGNGSKDDGLAVRLRDFLKVYGGVGGLLAKEQEVIDLEVKDIDERVLRFEELLELRERTLKEKFAAAERTISQLQASSNSIASAGSLTASRAGRTSASRTTTSR